MRSITTWALPFDDMDNRSEDSVTGDDLGSWLAAARDATSCRLWAGATEGDATPVRTEDSIGRARLNRALPKLCSVSSSVSSE